MSLSVRNTVFSRLNKVFMMNIQLIVPSVGNQHNEYTMV